VCLKEPVLNLQKPCDDDTAEIIARPGTYERVSIADETSPTKPVDKLKEQKAKDLK
jgi:hypothetical protein